MPSSTSSSESRAPPTGRWALTLGVAALVAFGALAALEVLWRSQGHKPSAVDDAKLWSVQRGRVYDDNVIAVVGSSRALLAVSLDTLRARLPRSKPVQLAIHGASPWLPLLDLLDDKRFHGTIVVDADEGMLDRKRVLRSPRPEAYLATFHEGLQLDARLNTLAAAELRARFVALSAQLSWSQVLRTRIETGAWPEVEVAIARPDRQRFADYSLIDAARQGRVRTRGLVDEYAARPPTSPRNWHKHVARLERGIRALQKRGGDVVFVNFPQSGRLLAVHQAAYPRADYWDAWAKVTRAKTLHFLDVRAMRRLKPPDSSHLDQREAPTFTNALVDELAARGVAAFQGARR